MLNLRQSKTAGQRRTELEAELSISLPAIAEFDKDENIASTRNCENMIGSIKVPLGIAGPLIINNDASSEYYLPLATTEGALVASISRGCKAIALSGGAKSLSYYAGVARGPVFKCENFNQNNKLFEFIESHTLDFQNITAATSSHLKLTGVMSQGVGLYRFVRFIFDSQDAMGMNMATIATAAIVEFIEEKNGVRCVSLSGNFCIDKKPAWQNFLNHRGHEVWEIGRAHV
jgi:hydroxymethylglutaryl-CoA reductase (NADPH)